VNFSSSTKVNMDREYVNDVVNESRRPPGPT
jgi:hypothetical protein